MIAEQAAARRATQGKEVAAQGGSGCARSADTLVSDARESHLARQLILHCCRVDYIPGQQCWGGLHSIAQFSRVASGALLGHNAELICCCG